jgi:hypothetical protein
MTRFTIALTATLAFTVAGCGGSSSKDSGGSTTASTAGGGGGGGGGGGSDTYDTSASAVDQWEPVAVGFELTAALYEEGVLGTYVGDTTAGPQEFVPAVLLTLASVGYFSGRSDEFCEITAIFLPLGAVWDESWDGTHSPMESTFPTTQMASYGPELGWTGDPETASPVPHVGWEGYLEVVDDQCTGMIPAPSGWSQAPGASDYATAGDVFDGMHFAIQVAPHSDYLRHAFKEATWFEEYEMTMTSHYICIEYAEGMRCEDWTTGYQWSFDMDSMQAETNGSNYFVPQDVTTIPPGSPLPPSYINSAAYWYQDFPLMDFEALKNGM